jgi:hypothetical protein
VRWAAAEKSPAHERAVLRADWVHPIDSVWEGTIRLSAGRIESVRGLQLAIGQVSFLPAADETEVHFRSAGPANWSGFEITIEAPAQARVELELDGHKLNAAMGELLQGSAYHLTTSSQARLRRMVSDMVAVRASRMPLIFAPGDSVDFAIEFRSMGWEAAAPSRFQVALRKARDGAWLFSREAELPPATGAGMPIQRSVTVRMPSGEGVYDLVIRAESDERQPSERVVQFVVLNGTAAQAPSEFESRLVQEIDPLKAAATARWYSTRGLRARTTRLGQRIWTSVRHPFGPPEHARESPLVSYRLKIDNPGRAHLVSIDYEDCGNLMLATAVSESGLNNEWMQMPLAGGIRTDEKPFAAGVQSHQLAFWPQTANPIITLSVEGTTGLSAVRKLRVHEMPVGLPVLQVPEADDTRRFFGLYLDNPDTWASWSSGRAIDACTHLPIDDWRTFLDAMTHLAEYASFAGHNSMMVTVVGDGGVLYPSSTLEATYRLDNGSLNDSGADPIQKDVLELFLRICQRHRLGFVPSVRFDGAIVSLDASLAGADPHKSGTLLVSREGEVWGEHANTGQRRYNPLSPDVQAAMLQVIHELIDRYGMHAAFAGLALDLADNSHAVLPSLEWGYDDSTIERFCRETGVEIPAETGDDRFGRRHQVLTSTAREQWIAWRCRQLAVFYEAVLAELRQVKAQASLFVNLRTLTEPGATETREPNRTGRTLEDSLRPKGIDLRNWSAPQGIVVLRPFVASGTTSEGLKLNSSREIDDLMSQLPARGSLCIHSPEMLNLVSPSNADKSNDSLAEPLAVSVTPPGRLNTRRYAQSLAASDCVAIFEGGPIVPLGNEQVQREFARVFRSLPTNEFRSLETLQPVVVRSCRESQDSLIYLVNDASYAVETNLSFNCAANSVLSNGSSGDRLTTYAADQGLGARLSLEPFQTLFLRLSGPEARVVQCDVLIPQAAERGLKVRFDRLKQAMDIMGSDVSRTLEGLPPNGDFEELAEDGLLAHWSRDGENADVAADSQVVHSGTQSLRLAGPAGSIAASQFFPPPDGRALAMNVRLRAGHPNTRVRWFLAGEHNHDTIYRCYADVTLGTNWEAKQFRARDLPDGQIHRIQVRFQLLDEGTLWVDEARVCALPISQDEKLAISKSVSAIYKAWKERRWSDFERLSDGYWPTYLMETVESAKKQ